MLEGENKTGAKIFLYTVGEMLPVHVANTIKIYF